MTHRVFRLFRIVHEDDGCVCFFRLERRDQLLFAIVFAVNFSHALLQLRVNVSELFGAHPGERVGTPLERWGYTHWIRRGTLAIYHRATVCNIGTIDDCDHGC